MSDRCDSSDEEGEFDGLFKEKILEDEVFTFKGVEVRNLTDGTTEVSYVFNFSGNSIDLRCRLIVGTSIPDELYILLLLIGLCMLPWYWMGFATKRIIINSSLTRGLLTPDLLEFFNTLYQNVLAEFMFVNKLNYPVPRLEVEGDQSLPFTERHEDIEVTTRSACSSIFRSAMQMQNSDANVLLPLGGKIVSVIYTGIFNVVYTVITSLTNVPSFTTDRRKR
jgi:hypothetical protein